MRKRWIGRVCVAAAVVMCCGMAGAQVQITVHMTDGTPDTDFTDGTGHFVGSQAVQDAVWALQHNFDGAGLWPTNGENDNATVTILDSGHYVGGILVGCEGLTINCDAGQAPTIEGHNWAQTVIVGIDYSGAPLPGSVSIIGDANENRITLIGSQVTPHYGVHLFELAQGCLLENINYEPGQEPGGCPENHHGHPVVVEGTATGNYTLRNVTLTMTNTSVGAGSNMQNGPWIVGATDVTFDNVDFVSGGFWTHGVFNAAASVHFMDCSIIGQGCNYGAGVVDHLRTTFLGNAHPIRDDVWPGTADIDLTFDDCTFTSGSDVMVGMVNGGSVTVKNSTITNAGATVLAARVRKGFVAFENCVIDGPAFDNWGDGGAGQYVEGVGANLSFDRCTVLNGSHVNFIARPAGSTGASTVNVNNTIWNGTAGFAISAQPLMDGETIVAPGILNATHSTFFGAYSDIPLPYGNGELNMSYCIVDSTNSGNQYTLWGNTDVVGQGNLLWDGNSGTANMVGSGAYPADTIVADPLLDADGHITNGDSPALAAAIDSTETLDVDGESRPMPVGTVNDIGADESDAEPVFTVMAETARYQTPRIGESATFMVSIKNAVGDVTYEWFFDNGSGAVAIPDSNAPGITVDSVEEGDQGTYWCVATDDEGSANSPTFIIAIPPAMPLSAWPVLVALAAAAVFVLRRRTVRSH